jgi:RNA polymerase sporulation-specific sigma factor
MGSLTVEEKETLAEENYKLIHHLVRKYGNRSYNYDDLYGAGQLGMVKALNTFDTSKDIKFATYAARCIVNEIFMVFRRENKHMSNISIDTPVAADQDGGEVTILDFISAPVEEDEIAEVNPAVTKVVKRLNERDQTVLKMFFEGKSQKEIGESLGYAQSYISRIMRRTFEEIKKEYWRGENDTMAAITLEEYKKAKDEGKTDKRIAEEAGITPAYISQLKNKWFADTVKPVVEKVKEQSNVSPRMEKESELQAIVNELSEELEKNKKTISLLEAQVKELENTKAACSDIEEETSKLQEELTHERKAKLWAQEEYSRVQTQLEKTDAMFENMKQIQLENQKTISRYVKENKALRELVALWI